MQNNLIIGIDIGGTRTKAGLVDIQAGTILYQQVLPTETKDAHLFLLQMKNIVDACTSVAAASGANVGGIAFGVPGYTNQNGVVSTTFGSLEFMEDYPLKVLVEAAFGMVCKMDNDARVVTLGEALYGTGKGYERVLCLTLGTGVGFGFVTNGHFIDPLPLAHMGGHIKIADDDVRCYCGKTGCLEALVSASGIQYLVSKTQHLHAVKNVETVFDLAATGNQYAIWVVEKLVGYLHTAIHNYVNLFAPDIVVLGGGIAKGLGNKLIRIKGESYMTAYPGYLFDVAISTLEEQAGILGSAALFYDHNNT